MSVLTHSGNASSGSSNFITAFGITIPAGSLIVVHTHDADSSAPVSVSDTAGNTYHLAGNATQVTGNVSIWYCYNCLALTGGQVHYTPANTTACGLDVNYATGMNTTAIVLDSVNTVSNSTGVGAGVSLTPANAGCLLTAIVGGSGSFVQNGSWATPPDPVFSGFDISGSLIDSGNTTETYAPTGSAATSTAMVIAAFVTGVGTVNTIGQTLPVPSQAGNIFDAGAAGKGLRQFSTYGG